MDETYSFKTYWELVSNLPPGWDDIQDEAPATTPPQETTNDLSQR